MLATVHIRKGIAWIGPAHPAWTGYLVKTAERLRT
jgi:hypothetical protein